MPKFQIARDFFDPCTIKGDADTFTITASAEVTIDLEKHLESPAFLKALLDAVLADVHGAIHLRRADKRLMVVLFLTPAYEAIECDLLDLIAQERGHVVATFREEPHSREAIRSSVIAARDALGAILTEFDSDSAHA